MEPNKTPETPKKTTESGAPETTTPQPAPLEPQQPAPAPQAAQQQYVVTHKSLEGVGGWLAFWLVLFALSAIAFIYTFFAQISGEAGVEFKVVDVIFSPILAIMSIATILLVVMRKQIGKWVAIATLATSGIYSMINVLTSPIDNVAMVISSLLVMWLLVGLFALYFLKSERVKQTLTK